MASFEELHLDADENEYRKQVSLVIQQRLATANDAAVLTLNGLIEARGEAALNEPRSLSSLLMAKCAREIRFGVTGLTLGYYSGASAVLRSAFDALAYAALFLAEPSQVAHWLRAELSSSPLAERDKERRDLQWAARRVLVDLERERRVIKDATQDFLRTANENIHASILGIAQQFGLPLEWLIPSDFEAAFSKAGDDFERALSLYVLIAQQPTSKQRASKVLPLTEQETVEISLVNRYDEFALDELALFAFYISHRLLDLTENTFSINDRNWVEQVKEWHHQIRQSVQ